MLGKEYDREERTFALFSDQILKVLCSILLVIWSQPCEGEGLSGMHWPQLSHLGNCTLRLRVHRYSFVLHFQAAICKNELLCMRSHTLPSVFVHVKETQQLL